MPLRDRGNGASSSSGSASRRNVPIAPCAPASCRQSVPPAQTGRTSGGTRWHEGGFSTMQLAEPPSDIARMRSDGSAARRAGAVGLGSWPGRFRARTSTSGLSARHRWMVSPTVAAPPRLRSRVRSRSVLPSHPGRSPGCRRSRSACFSSSGKADGRSVPMSSADDGQSVIRGDGPVVGGTGHRREPEDPVHATTTHDTKGYCQRAEASPDRKLEIQSRPGTANRRRTIPPDGRTGTSKPRGNASRRARDHRRTGVIPEQLQPGGAGPSVGRGLHPAHSHVGWTVRPKFAHHLSASRRIR
jgi:hypothetical protein